MESEKKGFAAWVRKHRKQLIKAGLSVAAVAALIAVAYIKRDSIAELWQNLKALLEKSNSSKLITSDEVIRQETTILTEINENVCSITEQTTISAKHSYSACTVAEHLRKLPRGQHPSPSKYPELELYGLTPEDGYTVITEYQKGAAIAA